MTDLSFLLMKLSNELKTKLKKCKLFYPHSLIPLFIGNHGFHESHKSNLIRKDPSFYKPKFKNTVEGLQYIWSI
jgi:hypothetical protein